MAEEAKTVEAVTAELSKPENKAELESTLNDAFKQGTETPAEAKPAEAAPAAEQKTGEETIPPKEGEDLSKKAGEADEKGNRVKELLADRNVAETEAANKQTEVQALTKQVADLAKIITDLKAGKTGEAAVVDDDGADDKPMTKKEVDAYLEKKLQEKNSASEQLAAAEKSIANQIQALETNKETPYSKDFTVEIKSAMIKFPGMNAYAAYCMLVGANVIPGADVKSNANRTGTGNRSKTNLLDNKKPEDMSQAELLSYLKGQEKSGELKI